MMGHFDFAADGSSVKKNSWVVCLYGIVVNGCVAGSYDDFRRNEPDAGAFGKAWEIKS